MTAVLWESLYWISRPGGVLRDSWTYSAPFIFFTPFLAILHNSLCFCHIGFLDVSPLQIFLLSIVVFPQNLYYHPVHFLQVFIQMLSSHWDLPWLRSLMLQLISAYNSTSCALHCSRGFILFEVINKYIYIIYIYPYLFCFWSASLPLEWKPQESRELGLLIHCCICNAWKQCNTKWAFSEVLLNERISLWCL